MTIKAIYIFIGSLFLIAICIACVFFIPRPSLFVYNCYSVVLAMSAAAFMIALPGTINAGWSTWAKATGSFGVFLVILIVMFVVSPPEKVVLSTVSGRLVMADNPQNVGLLNDLYFAVVPPPQQKYPDGAYNFTINEVPVTSTDEIPVSIVVLKKGYKTANVTVQPNSTPSDFNRYIIRRIDNRYVIDTSTPVVLFPEDGPSSSPEPKYSGGTGTTAQKRK